MGWKELPQLHAVLVCASFVQPGLARILTRRRTVCGGADVSLLHGCDLPLSGLSGSLSFELKHVAEFGCKLSDDGELSGLCQHVGTYTEELELVRHSNDLRLGGVPMRRAYNAGKSSQAIGRIMWKNSLETACFKQLGKCEGERVRQ